MSLVIQEQVSLRPYNTLAVDVRARFFVAVETLEQLRAALAWAKQREIAVFLLGGGSNLVLAKDLDVLVIHLQLRGINVLSEDDEFARVEVQAGENWHAFVQWSLAQGYSGLENLSLIPGSIGAAPVQNIGAYGVEVKDHLESVLVYDRYAQQTQRLSEKECQFAYRDSLFKRESGRRVILSIIFKLPKQATLHLDYGDLRGYLNKQGITEPTPQAVSRAVCEVRAAKLPDPAQLANTGSFFKNPVVSAEHAQKLKEQYPHIVSFVQDDGQVKLAAGWLIDQAGWKGLRQGDAAVHAQQALVLVNHGNASGQQILQLAAQIQADIKQRYGVELEIEPNIIA
ncbi:UDP-N-acetylmuramate dehydrogenase [Denitrificimonas sp. JX-1]|uniref:UDP-N-acetylenolpyruvoylglucosamine reductase n=1 Tax=Denitrificimonas halotolerans TaxID=3098930 RepID=A0ABU5GPB5_9GAMM|nr:UDP-N-acetylmuramate dehydrogenase [Denitrificimonas sp. JX-1]MDY7217996.1 UDP-N-acetylmuramate dehydrogenase [Denitrificimonas sp. JX-1]